MKRIFGIDFGTTTTGFVAFESEFNKYTNIGDREGRPFYSVVVIDAVSGIIRSRGLDAQRSMQQFMAMNDEFILIRSIKRELAKQKTWRAGNRVWKAEEIISAILQLGMDEIKIRWPDTKLPITAVCAIPVEFSYEERMIIFAAAEKVGIDLMQFVVEPTAALVGAVQNITGVKNVIVVDWGGGTLDVSVLHIYDGYVEEKGRRGISLGGDDIDIKIARKVHHDYVKFRQNSVPAFEDTSARSKDRILVSCEQAKINLSFNQESNILVHEYEGLNLEDIIDREIFESLITEDLKRVQHTVHEALKEAGLSPELIDFAVLVGGSCQIPAVRRELDKIFPGRCDFPEKSEWCIAKGAACIAAKPGAHVLSKSIGIMLSDGCFMPVLRSGERLDNNERHISVGIVDDSKEARIILAESDARHVRLGESKVLDVLSVPVQGYHYEPVQVTFQIQKDLALRVKASGRLSNSQQEVIFPHLKFKYVVANDAR